MSTTTLVILNVFLDAAILAAVAAVCSIPFRLRTPVRGAAPSTVTRFHAADPYTTEERLAA